MDGVIIVNKEKDWTSNDVVQKLRKILHTKKVGHCGTLDPNATGVLPILIGKGTKISKYLVEHSKVYIATLKLGEKRTTGDIDGEIIATDVGYKVAEVRQLQEVLVSFLGKQKQTPPMYSAIKKDGKKLYEYARQGQTVEIEPRDIEIFNIKLLEINEKEKEIKFEVECSKGTYIRTLCEDISQKLGTVGYMKDLVRTRVNEFKIENALTLDEVNKIANIELKLNEYIISIESIFSKNEKIILDERRLQLFLNGVMLSFETKDGLYNIYDNNEFIGLGIIKNKLLRRDVVLD